MSFQDPIADCFTRIRNAQQVKHETVSMPSSKLKVAVVQLLQQEGYIKSYAVAEGVKPILTVSLKYYQGKGVISKIKRISKPSLRRYRNRDDLPRVLGGLGVAIVSTSKGIMSDKAARAAGIGGEIIGEVA